MARARLVAADRLIGIRIRKRRVMSGLSQRQLGDLVGVAYQQVNKYEHGINGVSAGRLYEIARALSTPLEYFVEDLEQDDGQLPSRQRLLFDVVRNFGEVQNEKCLEAINNFIRALAGRWNDR